jgi:hypothetical protein
LTWNAAKPRIAILRLLTEVRMVLHLLSLLSVSWTTVSGMNCMTSSDPVETLTSPQRNTHGSTPRPAFRLQLVTALPTGLEVSGSVPIVCFLVDWTGLEPVSRIKLLHLIHAYRLAWASSELASGSSGNLPSACISPIRPTTLPRKLKNCGESS